MTDEVIMLSKWQLWDRCGTPVLCDWHLTHHDLTSLLTLIALSKTPAERQTWLYYCKHIGLLLFVGYMHTEHYELSLYMYFHFQHFYFNIFYIYFCCETNLILFFCFVSFSNFYFNIYDYLVDFSFLITYIILCLNRFFYFHDLVIYYFICTQKSNQLKKIS